MNWIIVCWIIFCIVAVTTYYNICIRPKLSVRMDDSDFSDYYIFSPKDIHPEIFFHVPLDNEPLRVHLIRLKTANQTALAGLIFLPFGNKPNTLALIVKRLSTA